MAALSAIRQALADQLAAQIPGLRTAATVPGSINPPVAVIHPYPGTFAEYQITLPPNQFTTDWTLVVHLLVSQVSTSGSQDRLDAYCDPEDSQSVVQAVAADPTLGGVVDYAVVKRAQRYGLVIYAGLDYLGAEIIVEVS